MGKKLRRAKQQNGTASEVGEDCGVSSRTRSGGRRAVAGEARVKSPADGESDELKFPKQCRARHRDENVCFSGSWVLSVMVFLFPLLLG